MAVRVLGLTRVHGQGPGACRALDGVSLDVGCQRLIKVANDRGGKDNITTVLFEIVDK